MANTILHKRKKKPGRPRKKTTTAVTDTSAYSSVGDMANDVRGVLKSVIKQDGKYTTREAGVVGKLYGAELSRMKLQVEIHKMNTKASSKTAKPEDVLSLS